MTAARSSLAIAALALALPVAESASSSRSCTGRFECSEYQSATGGGGLQKVSACKFGHNDKDGGCEKPCTGVRRAPCLCIGEAEAAEGSTSQGWKAVGISAAITLVSLACAANLWKRLVNTAGLPSSEADKVADVPLAAGEPSNNVAQATVVGVFHDDAQGGAAGPSGADPEPGSVVKSTSRIQVLTKSSGRLAQENPQKFNIIRVALPCCFLAAIGYAVYTVVSRDNGTAFYEEYGKFMSVVVLVVVLLGFAGSVAHFLIKRREGALDVTALDNPVRLAVAAVGRIWFAIPIVGLAGLLWGVIVLINPNAIYHNACVFM